MVTLSRVIVLLALGTSAGCASLSLPFGGGRAKVEVVHATQQNPVMEAISLWEPGEGRGLDNLPSRGFAGQVLFFTYKHPTPAKIDGSVTIYVFDDHGTPEEQARPMFQHTFGSQEWNALCLQTNLGTAYQIFVPYPRKGQHTAHCSLRVKFEPADGGPPVYSKMANVVLEGKETHRESQLARRRIEPARLDQSGELALQQVPPSGASHRMRTSSVSMPGRDRLSAQSAARLQHFAEEMVRAQRDTGGVEQAAYFAPSDDVEEEDDDDAEPLGTRYRLHR